MRTFLLIGGMPRSGTTLLETVIGSHSRIAVPPGDFPFAEQHARNLSVEKIFAVLATKSTWKLWPEQNFVSLFDRDHGTAFRESMLRYAAALDKDIPAAKAPYSEFFYDTYVDWLAEFDLKFIHMIRNPFDVIASLKKSHIHRNWQPYADLIEVQSQNWLRSITLGLARQSNDAEHYRVIKYEDFVRNPASMSEQLCRFLGVDFEQVRMLDRSDFAYHDTNTSFPDVEAAFHQASRHIYQATSRKQYLDTAEITLVAAHCGEAALALGYEDTDIQSRPPSRVTRIRPSVRLRRKLTRLRRRLLG